MLRRANPDEETTFGKAVCGRTARTVWRAGRIASPTPIKSKSFACKQAPSAPVMAHTLHGGSPCRGKPRPRSRRLLRHREVGWRATLGELAVRRMTNLFRRGSDDELSGSWRSLKSTDHAEFGVESDDRVGHVVEGGTSGSVCAVSGETCRVVVSSAGVRALVVPRRRSGGCGRTDGKVVHGLEVRTSAPRPYGSFARAVCNTTHG